MLSSSLLPVNSTDAAQDDQVEALPTSLSLAAPQTIGNRSEPEDISPGMIAQDDQVEALPTPLSLAAPQMTGNRSGLKEISTVMTAPAIPTTLSKPHKRLEIKTSLILHQYRSYRQEIIIFHYAEYIMPLSELWHQLKLVQHGYIGSVTSHDPLHGIEMPEGDEIPEGRLEVAFLPKMFRTNGAAICFRHIAKNKSVYLCYRDNSLSLLESCRGPKGEILFAKVAVLPNGPNPKYRGETGYKEHRNFYYCFTEGAEVSPSLKLTWQNWVQDMKRAMEEERAACWDTEEDEEEMECDDTPCGSSDYLPSPPGKL
ncbi:hypothetical protein BDV95DRAFT_605368 [Massariosphaeria phaeospora]|uniref:Uncharacterized protein n=1 Tax=Massariosphaeria phaeospora TaxID=100035 RepID=A0A7C8MCY2_9PLEO|nr:hypothetical protein BDV95DRAFT_605368 [Massariosphaeria phaeospora]